LGVARRLRRSAVAGVVTALTLSIAADGAGAVYGPGAEPISATATELGDRGGGGPVISGDGRYVAFSTESINLLGPAPNPSTEFFARGIARKDLLTGVIELVAPPQRRSRADGSLLGTGTTANPAGISDDGRYILFGTPAPLLSSIDKSSLTPDVYLRDMSRPLSATAAYELVSSRHGSEVAPAYKEASKGSVPGAAGFALSDDGRRAVFVTSGESNLPASATMTTPLGQVFVRDLDADTTRLVTRDRDDPTLPGTPVPYAVDPSHQLPSPLLSGDGRAVVWVAPAPARQARFLPGENTIAPALLWRDLDAPPGALSRRVAGAADPDDPGCLPGTPFQPSSSALGPCYGPFGGPETIDGDTSAPAGVSGLAISDDGRKVMFGSSAAWRPFSFPTHRPNSVYVAEMDDDLPRKAAVRRVVSVQPALGISLGSGSLAGDGRHALVVSNAAQFEGPQPVGGLPTGALVTGNAYLLDLIAGTIELVTRAHDGGDYRGAEDSLGRPIEPGLSAPLLSDDGRLVVFTALDGNLFAEDVNRTADVQLVRHSDLSAPDPHRGRTLPSPPPFPDAAEPVLHQSASARATIERARLLPGGRALLLVRVPAPGVLDVKAVGRVPLARGSAARRLSVGADRRRVRRSGRVRLTIVPTPAARQALRLRPHRIAVRLHLRYRATGQEVTVAGWRYVLAGSAGPR
jgi:hypothetical protein